MKGRYFARLSAILLVLTFLFCLTACGKSPNAPSSPAAPDTSTESKVPDDKKTGDGDAVPSVGTQELATLRLAMAERGCGIAAACLGWFEGDYDDLNGFLQQSDALTPFPFLRALPAERFVDHEGGELYLIIPEIDDAVRVCDWVIDESNGYSGAPGERTLYQSESGEPFLLQCNVSDIMPNTVIYTKTNKRQPPLVYNPALSLRDGTVSCPAAYAPGYGVLGLSAEGDIEPLESLTCAAAEDIIGMWEGYVLPDDGRSSNSVYFELHEDGTMFYTYSVYDMQTENYAEPILYSGTWEYCRLDTPGLPIDAYRFDLTLQMPPEDGQEPFQTISTTQYIISDMGGISLQIVEGDDLYPNGWEYPVLLSDASDGAGRQAD